MYATARRPISRGPSPMPYVPAPLPYEGHGGAPIRRPPSSADFRVEKVARSPSAMGRGPLPSEPVYHDEAQYRQRIAALIAVKDRRQFAATGHVVADVTQLVLFFRSKSGINYSLDFPIDVDYNLPPSLDVLTDACRPHQTSDYSDYMDRESLFYPPTLPLTTSFEISNHPILDAVRTTLLPDLPAGHFLTAVKDKLEILIDGGRLARQLAHLRNDGRAATILLTLPVRFQGGALIIRDPSGIQERFFAKSRGSNDLEWVAFLANCDYETEVVEKGYRVLLSYGVYVKSFNPELAVNFDSLSTPADDFFDRLAPLMNLSRGRKIAFQLSHDYNVNPSQVSAASLVSSLKGGDYLLYNALKMYKLAVDLHWTAGEYFWPADRLVEFFGDDIATSNPLKSAGSASRVPFGALNGPRGAVPPIAGVFNNYPASPESNNPLRAKVEESGGLLLADASITLMTDWANEEPVGAVERVPFISHGELKKLVVNVLMVVFIP